MMKKLFLLAVFLLTVCNLVFAQFAVDETKTMDYDTFQSLRNATASTGYDDVMRWYWCKLIGITPPVDGEEGDDLRENRAEYQPLNMASYYAKEAFWGAIGHETNYHQAPDQDPEDIMELARKYLLDYNFLHYLNLDLVWDEYSDGSGSDCLNYGSVLNNVANIVDMLWYFDNGAYQTQLEDKLNDLAGWACC